MTRWILTLFLLLASVGCLTSSHATVNAPSPSAANRYTGDGTTTVFNYTFEIYDQTALTVSVDGAVKTINTDYTVSGVNNSGGGAVTFLAAPATGTIVTLLRNQPPSQLSVYTPNEPFPAKRIEHDLDKVVMQVQQLKEQMNRALQLNPQSTFSTQYIDDPSTTGLFARAKVGGGIDWASVTSSGTITVPVPVNQGGTGATTAAVARTNLGTDTNNATIDAKGDLLAGSADNTLARLQSNTQTTGHVLTVNPAANTGLSWGPRAQDNPIINGNMEIWQRGTAQTGGTGLNYMVADRWKIYSLSGAGNFTTQQSTDVPTVAQAGVLFNYSLEVLVNTADNSATGGDEFYIAQRIEGYNWRHFAQRDLTLSFWVRSSVSGIHTVAFLDKAHSAATADQTYIAEYTISAANTWQKITVNLPASPSSGTWNYTNGIGLEIDWHLQAGATVQGTTGSWINSPLVASSVNQVNDLATIGNVFRITGVKLELGSVATPIQFVAFEQELARAERYYQKSFEYAQAPIDNLGTYNWSYPSLVAGAVTNLSPFIPFPTMMRAAASVTLYQPLAVGTAGQPANVTDNAAFSAASVVQASQKGFNVSSTGTAGTAVAERISFGWAADAEL